MNKHGWRLLSGAIMVLAIFVPYKIIWYGIDYTDQIWNKILWQPLLKRDIPLVGSILMFILLYVIGALNETKFGIWFHENIVSRIPIVKHLVSSFNPKSKKVLEEAKGFILAPFLDGYRPAKLMAVLKKKDGYFGIVSYLTAPPTNQILEDTTLIYALETVEAEGVRYGAIPSDTSIRIELSAGTTVPENALIWAKKITLGEFLRSYKFINNGEKENQETKNPQ